MRRAVIGLLAASILLMASADTASAAGRTYHVLKCHPSHWPADELQESGNHGSYERVNRCNDQAGDPMFGIYNDGAAGNQAYEQFMYTAPPATLIRRVCLQHRLRRQSHHRAEILVFPGFQVLATGGDQPSGWSGTECYWLDHEQLIVRLACAQPGGCADGPNAHAYVRNLDIELVDLSDPQITRFGGDLLDVGWIRGSAHVAMEAADGGAGVATQVLMANGQEIASEQSTCGTWGVEWPYSGSLVPCPTPSGQLGFTPNTSEAPFVNGPNEIRAVAFDYPGNESSVVETVFVDNAAPAVVFAGAQDPEDPELIRAPVSDVHSGVSAAQIYYRRVGGVSWLPLETRIESGEARTRIDSSALPAGDYEFKAEASDVAGNNAETTLRQNGTPMRLTFPLRFATALHTRIGSGGATRRTVPYGTSSAVHGRLTDGSGEPIADREVEVIEHFGDGALIRERPTTAITDADGEFRTKVPAGPSRRIEVRFEGSQKYRPAKSSAGLFSVRSRATFKTSAEELLEGERVAFRGRVAHRGARIPAGGKLIELQVRIDTGRWDTVKEAFRTDGNGRYRLGYRFGRHYVSDARFRFRVKVQDEGDWPFERATSQQRSVVVRAR